MYPMFFFGVGMTAYGITALWFGVRNVLAVGGYCAEGGPYVIQQHCPEGTEILMLTGLVAGLIGLFVAMLAKSPKGAAGLLLLSWPALFIGLGWNFIDFAMNPPLGKGGTAGWWFSGAVSLLMGLPALLAVPGLVKGIGPERRGVALAVFLAAVTVGVAFGVQVARLHNAV